MITWLLAAAAPLIAWLLIEGALYLAIVRRRADDSDDW